MLRDSLQSGGLGDFLHKNCMVWSKELMVLGGVKMSLIFGISLSQITIPLSIL